MTRQTPRHTRDRIIQQRSMSHGENAMSLRFGKVFGEVVGGPYAGRAKGYPNYFGIKLAPEVRDEADIEISIRDFGCPEDNRDYMRAVETAVVRAIRGGGVYVGCLMGQGRTGTFLAMMAKVCGERPAVSYTRRAYNPRAVETRQQEEFVENTSVVMSQIRVFFRLLFGR